MAKSPRAALEVRGNRTYLHFSRTLDLRGLVQWNLNLLDVLRWSVSNTRMLRSMNRFLRSAAKTLATTMALLCMVPSAAATGFGRVVTLFQFFGQLWSLVPGLPGDYLRVAYYAMTLRHCSLHSRISFGSFFAQRESVVERGVYIGSHCVFGSCHIGARTQIANQVQILSGRRQHIRDEQGRILGSEEGTFTPIKVGADCWLGASSVIMADVGARTTIGAGAIVPRPVPANVVAVGNPAKVLEREAR